MAAKKTWREKLESANGLPKVSKIEGKMSKRWGSGTMVIPAPLEVDAAMQGQPPPLSYSSLASRRDAAHHTDLRLDRVTRRRSEEGKRITLLALKRRRAQPEISGGINS